MSEAKRCHRLKSLSVVGGFLDGLNVDFADGLNCLIGHRGTGKTTVLEFVRYALDGFPAGEAGQVCRRRVENLVKRNLGDGRIRLTIQTKDGLEYVVDRTVSGSPLVLTADGQPTDITINSGGIFSADIFSQNEVENIADSPESQLALIDTFVAEEMGELETAIAEVHAQLQANAKTMVPGQITLAKLADELTTLKSVEDRIEKLADVGGENADEMNAAQTHKALRDRESRAMESADKLFNEYLEWLGDADGRFTGGVDGLFADDVLEGPNGEVLQTTRTRMRQAGAELDELFRQAVSVLTRAQSDVAEQVQELQTRQGKQELAFRDLMTKFKEAQGLATERAEWERKRNDLLNKKRQHADLKAKLEKLQQDRRTLIDRLTDLRDQRFQLRQSVSERISEGVSSPVRDVMRPSPDDTIMDPAAGTGGFLTMAYESVLKRHEKEMDRDEKRRIKEELVTAQELVPETARLCAMNLYLHGITGGKDENSTPVANGHPFSASSASSTRPGIRPEPGGPARA